MKPKNIPEFKKLVEKYETITLQEIKDNWKEPVFLFPAANFITGFGDRKSCTLCIAVDGNGKCENCIYGLCLFKDAWFSCNSGKNEKSYYRIKNANTPRKLLNAFRARAEHLRENYPEYLK